MGPIPGQYQEFFIGVGKDLTKNLPKEEFDKLTIQEKWERIFIKEAIGHFLKLNLAGPRFGVFDQGSGAANAGRDFAYKKQKGSKAYQFGLIPGTKIPVAYGRRKNDGSIEIVKEDRTVRQFQLSLPRTVTVAEVIQWVLKGTIVNADGTTTDLASNTAAATGSNNQASGFDAISYIITPAGRKHPLRSLVTNERVPEPPTDVNQPGQEPITNTSSTSGSSNP